LKLGSSDPSFGYLPVISLGSLIEEMLPLKAGGTFFIINRDTPD
jgi:hypothetical protein